MKKNESINDTIMFGKIKSCEESAKSEEKHATKT